MAVNMNMLDEDNRWHDYCATNNIKDPFLEEWIDTHITNPRVTNDDDWHKEWVRRRDDYLRMRHTFRMWDFHFWMDWEEFQSHAKYSKDYTDISIYLPCDCAGRQCNMACAYFGTKCPREKEELKNPLNFEGRWEFRDTEL